ncbi:ATP-binding cassette domain-containing protein [Conexibacter sp. JD483]|uniref:ATP-binding cassette domain-containing protein n=1 Tax=unclassified Conexibacter TaxID=2627773 RepID=UPI00272188FF|nr:MULTISPECIES: ATP-binding cassette domain-containing protein [unclassified Conexibacter]MDO8184493.1 ATP-binding cassette domain-containing protein [Conexibacter sp. CPCC 205706]MDO8197799.1 ATP-binding cassette domain-containing protein [Conexibacter sp. CPCC 205762]MDR9369205.1 ATP-binding cassette domain-containing protein [Conexibacter sp. JD483]
MTLLRLDSISKAYERGPRQLSVLNDVTFALEAGEFVGIYGARGAGKTTLLRIAAGFDRPDDGAVTFAGAAPTLVGKRRQRHAPGAIAWVEQNGPHSGELPIEVFVALPLYRELGPSVARRRASEALARVGADDAAGARWSDLSDAARKLVTLAHALVRRPRLLLADDPAAGLGVIDRERVTSLLHAAAHDDDCAVLMTAPELAATRHADRALLLSRGQLLTPAVRDEDGTVLPFPGQERRA